jgi:hypothetical protein
MMMDQVNELLRDLAEEFYNEQAAALLEMLHDEDLADMMYERDMQMYACHSYESY